MDQDREHVRRWLEAAGCKTKNIDEADTERADLLVSDEAANYLVEVKSKEISEKCQDLIIEADSQGTASIGRQIERRNRLDGIVAKANSQLMNTPAPASSFRILWVCCLMGDVAFIHKEFERALYGKQLLIIHDKTGKALPSTMPCFYYDQSSLLRYREIDAVVLSGPESGYLCINEFSQRLSDFRRTRLFSLFSPAALIDPVYLEKSRKALAIRQNIDRKDTKAKWQYLLDTYGYMTAPMQECQFTGIVSIPLADA